MLDELTGLLAAAHEARSPAEFARAIVEENVLGKSTASTRRLTAQRLTELYALDTSTPIFRALHRLWPSDEPSRPLLALLVALARDPLLRATARIVLPLRGGESLDRDALNAAVQQHAGARLNPGTTAKVARNAASSWAQSGHLVGRTFKSRQRVQATPASATLAILLGYLQGLRSRGLFQTLWCDVLDATPEVIAASCLRGAANGWIEFRMSGDAIEVGFPELLSRAEIERTTHG